MMALAAKERNDRRADLIAAASSSIHCFAVPNWLYNGTTRSAGRTGLVTMKPTCG
jgi:hypothetical protein